MTEPRYLTFPQIARMGANLPSSPFTPADVQSRLNSDFFERGLSADGLIPIIGTEVGGDDDATGRRRGVNFGHARSPIGLRTEWRETSPEEIREMLSTAGLSHLAPDADLRRYGSTPLDDWHTNARKYILDNLALSVADARRWLSNLVSEVVSPSGQLGTDGSKEQPGPVARQVVRFRATVAGSKKVTKRGRPAGSGSLAARDRPLLDEMRSLIGSGECASRSAAAQRLVGKAAGGGDDASKIRRLVTRYGEKFPR